MINLLLVSHGSRDSRPQQAIDKLTNLLQRKLPKANIGSATLELGAQPLHQQIVNFTCQLLKLQSNSSHSNQQILILPLFLLPGTHVIEDIPREVNLARSLLPPTINLQVLPHLGSHGGMFEILACQQQLWMEEMSIDRWILLAHGSKYPHAHQSIKELAQQLNTIPAYWAVPPSLETQVEMLIDRDYQSIGILPYFLFPGGITDAIEKQVARLQQQFPQVQFQFADPLGATDLLRDLILDLLSTAPSS